MPLDIVRFPDAKEARDEHPERKGGRRFRSTAQAAERPAVEAHGQRGALGGDPRRRGQGVLAERVRSRSLQEIASNVGILKGSIYYYIKTKEDLLFEIIRRSQDVYALTPEEDDETAAAPAPVRLAAFIKRWTTLSPKQRDWGEVAEGSFTRLSPARLKLVIARRDEFSDYVKQIIQQGINEGAFDPAVGCLPGHHLGLRTPAQHAAVAPSAGAGCRRPPSPSGTP